MLFWKLYLYFLLICVWIFYKDPSFFLLVLLNGLDLFYTVLKYNPFSYAVCPGHMIVLSFSCLYTLLPVVAKFSDSWGINMFASALPEYPSANEEEPIIAGPEWSHWLIPCQLVSKKNPCRAPHKGVFLHTGDGMYRTCIRTAIWTTPGQVSIEHAIVCLCLCGRFLHRLYVSVLLLKEH